MKSQITLRLPPLDAYDALLLVDVLDSIISTLWHTHGDHMADIQARRGVDTPAPEGSFCPGNPNAVDDTDFNF